VSKPQLESSGRHH